MKDLNGHSQNEPVQLDCYITGLTALCIPHPNRFKPFWHSIGPADSWTIGGDNYPHTSFVFGHKELIDVSEFLAVSGIESPVTRCATYERAVFDLLYRHIEQRNQPVPNVQPEDINDVVDFDRILEWISAWERRGLLSHGSKMQNWLNGHR